LLNAIHEVMDPQGTRLTNQDDIKIEAVHFFSDLLSSQPSDFTGISVDELKGILQYRYSLHEQNHLVAEITEAEVMKVFFSMPLNKSPGPDGYTVEFFRETWSVIGQEVTMAIKSFFTYGFLPKGLKLYDFSSYPQENICKRDERLQTYFVLQCLI